MIRKHVCWKLVRVEKVFTQPGLNDVFLFSEICLLAKPFCSHSWKVFWIALALTFSYKQAETAETCLINNSNQNPFAFPPSCQE